MSNDKLYVKYEYFYYCLFFYCIVSRSTVTCLFMPYFGNYSNQFLVCPMKHSAVLMTLEGSHKIVPLEDEVNMNICRSLCWWLQMHTVCTVILLLSNPCIVTLQMRYVRFTRLCARFFCVDCHSAACN